MHAIVLGSGFGSFKTYFEQERSMSFQSVLGIEYYALDGHDREIVWCRYGRKPFVIISGKLHYYEGFTFEQVIAPLKYVIEVLGVSKIMVTSASGGLSKRANVGVWLQLNNIFSLPAVNLNPSTMRLNSAKRNEDIFHNVIQGGTYAYHQGPSLGSVAEYKMLHMLGADLVGMSMLPEYYYLASKQVQSHFISLPVCNYYPFEEVVEPEFEEVLKVSQTGVTKLVQVFKQYLKTE